MRLLKTTKPYQFKNYKIVLVLTVLALSILGVFVIGSAKESVQGKQILGLVVGLVVMLVVSVIDYERLLNLYWVLYAVNIVLLLVTLSPLGDTVNGAQRWIDLKVFKLQPSEITKILMILFFAKFFKDHEEDVNNPKTLFTAIALLAPNLLLILKQPDLSTTISIVVTFCAIVYLAGLNYKIIGILLAIAIPSVAIFLGIVVQPDQKLIEPYQQKRILGWLQPEKYANDIAYQQNNAIIAIGSGQLTGKGLNNNTTVSVKNGNYISEPQTDFIFAIVGEELGFVGCCIVIGLLLLIVIQCIRIGMKAQDLAGRLIACGVAAQIGFQSFINISVATGVFPNTGIPLPFVSYGLTSLMTMFMGIGIVLNVGLQPKKYQ